MPRLDVYVCHIVIGSAKVLIITAPVRPEVVDLSQSLILWARYVITYELLIARTAFTEVNPFNRFANSMLNTYAHCANVIHVYA